VNRLALMRKSSHGGRAFTPSALQRSTLNRLASMRKSSHGDDLFTRIFTPYLPYIDTYLRLLNSLFLGSTFVTPLNERPVSFGGM
jgi:hypothetical protein